MDNHANTPIDLDALERHIMTNPDLSFGDTALDLIERLRAARKVVEVARQLNALDLLVRIHERIAGDWDISEKDADAVDAAFASLAVALGEIVQS